MNTNTVALSDIQSGDYFAIDAGATRVMVTVVYNEYTSEAVIYYRRPNEGGTNIRMIRNVNSHMFTRRHR